MNETFLDNKKSEIKNLINTKSYVSIFKIFREVFNNVGDIKLFTDFVGEVFLMDPDYFMDKFADTYNKNITKLLNAQQLFEMEEYILQKFSLYQNEKIIISFSGEIARKRGKTEGRIYLTNYRLIIQGLIKSKGVTLITASIAEKAITKKMQKKMVKKLQSIMSQMTTTALPCFGYQYPIFGLQKIRVSGRKVIYTIRLKEELSSGRIISNKYVFIIKIYHIWKESSEDFNTRVKEITSKLQNTIVEASKLFEE